MKKYTLRLWQLCLLLIPFVIMPVILFLPFYSIDESVIKDTIRDSVYEYADGSVSEEEVEEYIDERMEETQLKEIRRAGKTLTGIDISSISGWDLLTLRVDVSMEEWMEDLIEEKDLSFADFAFKTVASSLQKEINTKLNSLFFPIRFVACSIFILCLGLLLGIVLTYIFKWNKFVVTSATAVYGGIDVFLAVWSIWIFPEGIQEVIINGVPKLLDQVSTSLSSFAGVSLDMDEIFDFQNIPAGWIGEVMVNCYKNMISSGFYALFVIGIFMICAAVVTMVTANKQRPCDNGNEIYMNYVPPAYIPGIAGKRGTYAGADIDLTDISVTVGKNPQICQIVVSGSQVNDMEFSIMYNRMKKEYVIDWNACNGWFEYPKMTGSTNEYEIQVLPAGQTYLLQPGTRICIMGGQEVFELR